MRISKRADNLDQWASVKVLSPSESREAWKALRKITGAQVMIWVALGPAVVFGLSRWNMTLLAAFALTVCVVLGLAFFGVVASWQRQARFERVRARPGLALMIRDWPETIRGEIDPTVGVYVTESEMITIGKDGLVQDTIERPDLRIDVSPNRGWVRTVWIGDDSWAAYEVPL